MTNTLIKKAGYEITISSWENDGDMRAEKTLHYSSKEDAKFIVAFCRLLKGKWGNIYDPSQTWLQQYSEAVQEVLEKYPDSSFYKQLSFESRESFDDFIYDLMYDLGLKGMEDNQHTRHVESIDVIWYKTDVYADIEKVELSVWT